MTLVISLIADFLNSISTTENFSGFIFDFRDIESSFDLAFIDVGSEIENVFAILLVEIGIVTVVPLALNAYRRLILFLDYKDIV
jgi:hypothetical protein